MALEIGEGDRVRIRNANPAHSGGGQVEESRAAESACSEDKDGAAFQAQLAGITNTRKAEVSGKTAELGLTKLRRG